MDFIDKLRQFSARVSKLSSQIQTEEATKTSLIMPFFQQVFGYDIFNPDEFVPEFTADVGTKKGEKVDYAIFLDGKPVILIEAKWCGATLEKHDSQLFRYFAATNAKFGILTNGIIYKFYTDLEDINKMDLKPFLELNLLDVKESQVTALKQFCKGTFDAEKVFNSASELRYSNEIKNYFEGQLEDPSDDFVKFFLSSTYEGTRTQAVIERFKPIVKNTLSNYINELMNDKITNALKREKSAVAEPSSDAGPIIEEPKHKIITTEQELEAFGIIKGMLCDVLNPAKISYRDTESYFSILYEGKVTKWICRLFLDGKKKVLIIPPTAEAPFDKETKYKLDSIDNLYICRDGLRASAARFA